MKIVNVASGSKGNATLIYEGNTLIQIDMGVSLKCLQSGLDYLGKDKTDIAACLITHEHSDHIKGLDYIRGVKIYAGNKTLDKEYIAVLPYVPFTIGELSIIPFSTHHDAINPLGYIIEGKSTRLGYVTDTGFLDENSLNLLADCDYYYFESNFDPEMLKNSNRTIELKRRIRSKHGHLSNKKSNEYLSDLIGEHTKGIYFAHISEECNTPELVMKTHLKGFENKHVNIEKIDLVCCNQWQPTFWGEK